MHRAWRRLCLIGAGIVWMTAAGCQEGNQEEPLLEEVEEIREEPEQTEEEKPEEEKICVHVCGQVASPGVYELPAGSRVYQAVEAAGGMTDGAAWQINQAQELTDGQQVYVPSKEEASDAGIGPGIAGQESDGKVNINTATKEELMTLSGIGEARAEAILKYREEKGGFQSTEELKEIDGIKDGIFGKIEDQIKI